MSNPLLLLPSSLTITTTNQNTIHQIKSLLRISLPIFIADSFYVMLSKNENEHVGLELRSDEEENNKELIGCLCYRVMENELYITAIAIDVRKRERGYGSYLLQYLLQNCLPININRISLHVQTSNDTAIQFYKKFGFIQDCIIERYYPRLQPSSACLLVWTRPD
jgi:ribosomal protein S18 acetylase RimI-like enzyme